MVEQKEDLIVAIDNLAASYSQENRRLFEEVQAKRTEIAANGQTIQRLKRKVAWLESRESEREFRQVIACFIGLIVGAIIAGALFCVPF